MASVRYRTRVIAQQLQETPDDAGGAASDWVPIAEFWAEMTPITGREQMRANQLIADMDTRFVARWAQPLLAITALHRLVVAGIPYSIVQPPKDVQSRHREIEFMCNVGLNDG